MEFQEKKLMIIAKKLNYQKTRIGKKLSNLIEN